MPSNKTTTMPDPPKRTRTDSTRKCEGRENVEAVKCEYAKKKAAAKARKELHNDTAVDDLLVKREGESPDFQRLRGKCFGSHLLLWHRCCYFLVLTLRLESENQHLKAKVKCCDKQDTIPLVKLIPEPANKYEVNIETLRGHIGLLGDAHDVQWSSLRVRTHFFQLQVTHPILYGRL
jgi:hypothetical protein